jgi:2-hydroxychromene-2-carboxylate isomerase
MGEVVYLDERRRRRLRGAPEAARAHLFLDLADPFSYLTAERAVAADRPRRAAERRAAELRLPLQWPDRFPAPVPGAMRAAAYAIEVGRGGAFMLAAGRLAFCGGFDLEEPDVLMEAAAASGLALDACLQAARDPSWDQPIAAAGRRLLAHGADRVPALVAEQGLLAGEAPISAYLASGAHRRAANWS